ncbi:tyrosinase family oxidase copper chaperone [Streptomyces coeruleoprunus]|uniref:Tyrosinase family oxidase copper chaperone n=1 Tax=Streptomyces coeruleoprunus TaxID=285563 RepID=A0ABV9XCU4_9ACTN
MIAKSPQPLAVRRFPRGFPRRGALRALFTLAVASFTGGTLAHVATTPRDGRPGGPAARPAGTRPGSRGGGAPGTVLHGAFDEMYRGRRIQGRPVPAHAAEFEVLVDDRPLHLMRCANGGYLSLVDHYQSYPTPLAATRAAVDELGTARLASVTHGSRLRGDHGVYT